MVRGSLEKARTELAGRLRERRGEIEEALLTRTYAIADPAETADPEYEQGLRSAVSAALEYGLAAVEHGEERAPLVPVLLLAQARLAARNGVPLDTVLRRYFAGYTLLGDFIVQEAGAASLKEPWLKRLLREQAAQFDRFLATVGEEYGREEQVGLGSAEKRRAERVERLLAGELLDTSDLDYDFEAHHTGVIASGSGAAEAIRKLATLLDRRLLLVRPREGAVWAWLGGAKKTDPSQCRAGLGEVKADVTVAIGEPGASIVGWRLTHRQAIAAMSIAQRSSEPFIRYADVALLASILQDDLLTTSLRQIYLDPLEDGRDGGATARETLWAYFAADGNVSSAAAALGVNRNTVATRLRAIEERLGRPIHLIASDLKAALHLRDFSGPGGWATS